MAFEDDRYPTRRTLVPLKGAGPGAFEIQKMPIFQYPTTPGFVGGREPGGAVERGYPVYNADTTALERAEGSRAINYADPADIAREMKGLQTGVRGGAYAAPGTGAAAQGMTDIPGLGEVKDLRYKMADPWAARDYMTANRANPGATAPGTRVVMNYGPAYGNTDIIGTADKTGRINQFSQSPGTPGGPPGADANDPYGIKGDLAKARYRAQLFRGGTGIVDKIRAAAAQRRVNALQALGIHEGGLDVQRGTLGVHQQQADTAAMLARPKAALANYAVRAALAGPEELTRAQQAITGRSDVMKIPGIGGTHLIRPGTVPAQGAFIPGFTSPNEDAHTPVPQLQPLHGLNIDDEY